MASSFSLSNFESVLTSHRDQTAINGAQIYFREALGLHDDNLLGLVNGAPYLCCALACCLNYPLNKYLERRGVIFATCLISSVTCLLQAFSQKWWHLFLARFALGFGIGPKSATIPIYAAEAAPENIRGALVMMWQMWTAFGIMCGYLSGVALARVGNVTQDICVNAVASCADHVAFNNDGTGDCSGTSFQRTLLSSTCSLNWRLMVGSPASIGHISQHRPLTFADDLTISSCSLHLHPARVTTCTHPES
jgi:MFS family permease